MRVLMLLALLVLTFGHLVAAQQLDVSAFGPLSELVTDLIEDDNKAQVYACCRLTDVPSCSGVAALLDMFRPHRTSSSTASITDHSLAQGLVNLTNGIFQHLKSSHNCTDAPKGRCGVTSGAHQAVHPSTVYPPTDAQPDFAVCQLNDVLLFNGSIYYVTPNPSTVKMPDVNLDWLSSGNLTKNQTDYNR